MHLAEADIMTHFCTGFLYHELHVSTLNCETNYVVSSLFRKKIITFKILARNETLNKHKISWIYVKPPPPQDITAW